ncbi:MAG: hypothetical protein QOG57_3680, partial [Pseudonocardiales bacterium]|nr:hypothetical protein [Pseudonocardiales bacterium]
TPATPATRAAATPTPTPAAAGEGGAEARWRTRLVSAAQSVNALCGRHPVCATGEVGPGRRQGVCGRHLVRPGLVRAGGRVRRRGVRGSMYMPCCCANWNT